MHDPLKPSDEELLSILKNTRTIAIVGASVNPARPSHGVMAYLQASGYRTIPVNPGQAGKQLLGEKVYGSLKDIPAPVDLVDIFRRSEEAGAAIGEAIAIGAKAVWLQLGIYDAAALARAQAAGLATVADHCTKIEHQRLMAGRP